MARRSLGGAAAAGSQLVTLAEVRALIAAAGGGGGSTTGIANVRPPIVSPAAGQWVRQGAAAVEAARRPLGSLRLGRIFLPEGTYDRVGCAAANLGTAASVLRFMLYGITAGGAVGNLIAESSPVAGNANTDGAGISAPISITAPAGGLVAWAGTVTQGAASDADGPNLYIVSRTSELAIYDAFPSISFTNTGSGWTIAGVTGAAPTSGSAATRQFEGHTWLTFRRAS